jgi:hypothetical protein
MSRALKLLPAVILGSVMCYYIIDTYIVEVSIWSYLAIEFLVTTFHELYNRLKTQIS